MYCEVVSKDGTGKRTQLVYGGTPEEAIRTARAYGLVGQIVEVRMLMIESVWIPPEVMPPQTRGGTKPLDPSL